MYCTYARGQEGVDLDELHKLRRLDINTRAKKNKSKSDLHLIHQIKTMMEAMKKGVLEAEQLFLKPFGALSWLNLFNSEESYTLEYWTYLPKGKEEDPMVLIITDALTKNDSRLMFSGNIEEFMNGCALEEEKSCNEPDFYSFPLFTIPWQLPTGTMN